MTLTAALGTSNSSLTTAYLIYQPDFERSINSSLVSPVAYSLSLNLCVQMMNTTVSNGVTQTFVVSSQILEKELFEIEIPGTDGDFYTGNFTTLSVDGFDFGAAAVGVNGITTAMQTFFSDSCYQLLNESLAEQMGVDEDGLWCLSLAGSSFLGGLSSSDPLSAIEELMQNLAISMTNT